MAIQNRRGVYADFDPSKLKPGEFAVVLSGDATASDGMAIYICTGSGKVKRLATLDELKTYDTDAKEQALAAAASAAQAAEAYLNMSSDNQETLAQLQIQYAAAIQNYNENASTVTEAFDSNAAAQTVSFDQNAADAIAHIDAVVESVDETYADMVKNNQDTLAELQTKYDAAIESYNANAKTVTETFDENAAEAQARIDAAVKEVNTKADAISLVTTEADQIATQALSKAGNVENELAEVLNMISTLQENQTLMQLILEGKVDGGYIENVEGVSYLYLTSSGEIVSDRIGPFSGIGGGGGSGGTTGNGATLSVQNTSNFLSKTIAAGDTCYATFTWSSIEDEMSTGDGTMKITVNGLVKSAINIVQGNVSVELAQYCSTGSNTVKVTISDAYGNSRTYNFTVTVVELSISSSFDTSSPFTGAISFPYVPVGSVTKTVHFILDGTEIDTVDTPVTNRQLTYTLPAQSHGAHSLEVYFTSTINGQEVESNHLYFEMICVQSLNMNPIITSSFNQTEANQYTTLQIGYQIYDPSSLTAEVELIANGVTMANLTVDRTSQVWAYKCDTVGELTLQIVSGGVTKTISLTVNEVQMDIEAETSGLQLYLSAYGRSNGEASPGTWVSGSGSSKVTCQFSGFNFINDGWQLDDDGNTVLRIANGAQLYIPFNMFAEDCRTSGKTFEVEFATRDVRDYDAEIISCMSGNRGLKITAQEARLKSAQSEIYTNYKDDEHIRLSFVITKRNETRCIFIYANGIMQDCVQYPDADDFSQTSPVGITLGSSYCTLDVYNMRAYSMDLTRQQTLNNWICDTPDGTEMLERYGRNAIYDDYGQIDITKLPKDLPYGIQSAATLPQSKGDKKTVQFQYVDQVDNSKSFTSEDASSDVQGTSSQYYYRKNYKISFKNGFITISGTLSGYSLRDDSIPTNKFTFKADVASSEGANNVVLARLANDINTWKMPAQKTDSRVRQTIDGLPIIMFWDNGSRTEFLGKYNFNNDKSTSEVFGFSNGDECWEVLNNTSDRVLFKDDDFTGTDWQNDFEGRYPEDNKDCTNLAAFVSWVKSTANDTTKFRNELENWVELDSALNYYIFAMMFLMVDSLAKNMMLFYSKDTQKWGFLWYDLDTALGINNEGQLVFGYNLEDIDYLEGGAGIFNGQGSVFWQNLRLAFSDEIAAKYKELRSGTDPVSYDRVKEMFLDHQNVWPEAIFNEDAQVKYLDPLILKSDAGYLAMLQGKKELQRDWWLYNRFRYLDSKWNCGDDQSHVITLRGYAKANITVTPYLNMYCNIKYGSYLTSVRAERNTAYTLACPLSEVNDTEIYIYSADKIISIGDVSGLKVGYVNIATAEKLQELKVGDSSSSYTNANMKELYTGNNPLLKKIDCRNCTALGTGTMAAVDVSGCTGLEEVYFDNTAITGLTLPNGGLIRVIHLPSTITNLTIQNQLEITDLTIPDYSNISTLVLENVSSIIDPIAILDDIADNARVRLVGFDLGTITADDLDAFMDKLDTFRGLDDAGNTVSTAQVSGTCHISNIDGSAYAVFKERYPYITITYDNLTSYVYYYNEDGSSLKYTEAVINGADATYTGTISKSSTAQYTYTQDGWSSTPGGSLWANAQKAISGDRNLYAHYSATIRTYTVQFYNGSTWLDTAYNVPYGGTAAYNGPDTSTLVDPDGSGQPFEAWVPSPSGITGDTTCKASYTSPKEVAEITDTWSQIVANINNGTYREKYKIGNYVAMDLGTEGAVYAQIVGFDVDTKADNSGTAPISFLTYYMLNSYHRMNPALVTEYNTSNTTAGWAETSTTGTYETQVRNTTKQSSVTQTATFVITASQASEISVQYKTSNTTTTTSQQKLTLTVDGETVTSTATQTLTEAATVSLAAGESVTVTASYLVGSSYSYYATLAFSGIDNCTITVTIPDVTYYTRSGYTSGTGGIGGWEDSEMRTYLKNTIKPLLPQIVRDNIVEVTKTQPAYDTSGNSITQYTTDDIWIPSYKEMFNTIANGGLYRSMFPDTTSRVKSKNGGSASWWWLRSASSTSDFNCVGNGGGNYISGANSSNGVAVGFCL